MGYREETQMGLGQVEGAGYRTYLVESLRTAALRNITTDIRRRVHAVLSAPLNPPQPPVPSKHKVDFLG